MTGAVRRSRAPAWILAAALGCSPIDDTVFAPVALEPGAPIVVAEGAGAVALPLRLREAPEATLSFAYRFVGIEAQSDCQTPDFEAPEGRVEWAPGVLEAEVRVWIGDDDLAELDERFALELSPQPDFAAPAAARHEIVITDDDRSALVEARERGVEPGLAGDQSAALQSVVDAARELGHAVVRLAPGDYSISSLRLPPGITLSARGARWHRPPQSPTDVVTLLVEHAGTESSASTLIEGLAIDGHRDEQGPYRDFERQDAHLVSLAGDFEAGGRVRATLEGLTLASGTASGVMVRNDAEVTICGVSASELWRDAITVVGGATTARIRNVDATATEGTGLWLGPRNQGFGESLALLAEVENMHVGAGDVEIEAPAGSSITLRGLVMTRPPFRLDAPGGVVRISSSVLMTGLPGELHDHWAVPHDVEVTDTTLVASAAVTVTAESMASGTPANGGHRLVFDRCRFELASDASPNDGVHALSSDVDDASIVVRSSTLGAGFAGWFAPSCAGCELLP